MTKMVIILWIIFINTVNAQDYTFRNNINKDSLFHVIIDKLPEELRQEYTKMYTEGNQQSRDYFLLMLSMPKSSKKKLIENYEARAKEIQHLKNSYAKLVPENLIVEIEFETASNIVNVPELITIKSHSLIKKDFLKGQKPRLPDSEDHNSYWSLRPGSKELQEALTAIGWTNETLAGIKKLLDRANCISIENGNITTIGFARSGMGLYSYKLFDSNLTESLKKVYDTGCEFVFYKENIVLEYGGGAMGPQCFEKD